MFSVDCESPPGFGHVVTVVGELDVAVAPRVTTVLADLTGDIALDCAGLTFMDSSGLRALERAAQAASQNGHRLVIEGLAGAPLRTAELCGLAKALHLIA
jgi:anti-anti-sigma factor